jgi:Initiator Replication protein
MSKNKKPVRSTKLNKTESRTTRRREKPKAFERYEQDHPMQLSLFQVLEPENKKYSNTVEIYDFLPKEYLGKASRVADTYLPRLEREFECRNKRYKMKLDPARIEDKDGTVREYYPSQREEVIENCLRKLMVEGGGVFLDDLASVRFTLYQLQKELKENGHTYSYTQIKESLEILTKTNIELECEADNIRLIFSPIETLGLRGEGEETQTFVRFSPLVTDSIKERKFRLINYKKMMGYRTAIARKLHKRMSHFYTQASFTDKYEANLSTLIEYFGLTKYSQMSKNLRDFEKGIEELKKSNTILTFTTSEIKQDRPRVKVVDYKISILPHPEFIAEVKKGSHRKNVIETHVKMLLEDENAPDGFIRSPE